HRAAGTESAAAGWRRAGRCVGRHGSPLEQPYHAWAVSARAPQGLLGSSPDLPFMETVFFESSGERHAQVIGGLTALERRIRDVARQGATRAVVAASPIALPRPLPIPVEFVAVGSAPPAGARRERADVIAGIELGDEAARRRAEWAVIRTMNK